MISLEIAEPGLIHIQSVTFRMGSDFGQEDEKPVHDVMLDPFFIAATAVTNLEYRRFLKGMLPEKLDQPAWMDSTHFDSDEQPVVGVSWFDAIQYCKWLGSRTGKPYRLPTEAEWEYAASGGSSQNVYPWGKSGWKERKELHSKFQNGPEPIRSFVPNSLGVYEMGMNIHEWCSDWYDDSYYTVSPSSNPKGPDTGTRRASRGGSWRHAVKITRCAARSSIPPHMRYADYGFRIAMDS